MANALRRASALPLLGYAAVAVAFWWPLPRHLGTHLTGPVTGDTGVYVWNLWLFRHEILNHHRVPFFTGEILSLTPPVDLGLHNYTTFANLLAFPLLPLLGVTATFNVTYITMSVLSAWSLFLLARHVIGRSGEAWLAGLLFGFSPFLMARGTAHHSLLAAAPLPIFLLRLLQGGLVPRTRDAAVLGFIVAWAVVCDVYYGVYCLMMAACYYGWQLVSVRTQGARASRHALVRAIETLSLCVAGLVVGILLTGGGELRFWDLRVQIRTIYTPVLILTVLMIARFWLTLQPRVEFARPVRTWPVATAGITALFVCAASLAPVLFAIGQRMRDDGALQEPVFWRSSPPGVDLLALILPNPQNPLFGESTRTWLTARPNGFAENAVSLPLVGVALLLVAIARFGFRPPPFWVFLTGAFGLLALGPFITVGGVNTFVPGPWAILRYAPLIGAARSPGRAIVILTLAFAVLVGLALAHIAARFPARRRVLLAGTAIVVLAELAPFPRPLYSAEVPTIYKTIAHDPRDVAVLELPVGIRDGVSSLGNFSAASQFYQTAHEKRLIGGYLSRISRSEIKRQRRFPVLRALMQLSEGRTLSPARQAALQLRGRAFVERASLGYVVVNRQQATPALEAFAVDVLGLERIGESDDRVLYRPRDGSPEGP